MKLVIGGDDPGSSIRRKVELSEPEVGYLIRLLRCAKEEQAWQYIRSSIDDGMAKVIEKKLRNGGRQASISTDASPKGEAEGDISKSSNRIVRYLVRARARERTHTHADGRTHRPGPALTADDGVIDTLVERFKRGPRRDLAVKAAKHCCDNGYKTGDWPVLAVLGVYLEAYEQRYRRKWSGTSTALREMYVSLQALVRRVGTDEVVKVIHLIFSRQFSWVTTNHLGALVNKDFYARYLVPALETNKSRSREQSEWSGEREEADARRVVL